MRSPAFRPRVLAALVCAAATAALAQTPRMVRDLDPTGVGSFPRDFAALGGNVYFRAQRGGLGQELWRSDGTAAGTTLVADLCPGPCSSTPTAMFASGGLLYFVARPGPDEAAHLFRSDGASPPVDLAAVCPRGCATAMGEAAGQLFLLAGHDLWRSDGSAAGTRNLGQVCPGQCQGTFSPGVSFVEMGGSAFLALNDSLNDVDAIWRSDGTLAGTTRLCTRCGWAQQMATAGGLLYFTGLGPEGRELWASDGTGPGTYVVRDINPGPGHSDPYGLAALGDRVLFEAWTPLVGMELWVSDGSPFGTRLVRDLELGAEGSYPWGLVALDASRLMFAACTRTSGCELWTTDGTDLGTSMIGDLVPGADGIDAYRFHPGAGEFWFLRGDAAGLEVWKTDGTAAGTRWIVDLAPYSRGAYLEDILPLGSRLFFNFFPSGGSDELWASDGTAAGTGQVARINSNATRGSAIDALTAVGDKVFFTGSDGTDRALWVSDGSDAGTIRLLALPAAFQPVFDSPAAAAGRLFFTLRDPLLGREFWTSDGTPAGTGPVADLCPGSCSIEPSELAAGPGGEELYFRADDGSSGYELWRSDGSAAGTALVADLIPGPGHSWPYQPTAFGAAVVFSADDGVAGKETWISDGRPGGTALLADTYPGGGDGAPGSYAAVGRELYFSAFASAVSRALWRSDGTPAGTRRVRDWGQGGVALLPPDQPAAGPLFFASATPDEDLEPWTSDGSEVGTRRLKDICPGSCSSIDPARMAGRLVGVKDRVVFAADDGVNGRELWSTDGSEAGTSLLADLCPGSCGLGFWEEPVGWGGRAWFTEHDPATGRELLVSDGSPAGTGLFAELAPGVAGSNPTGFTPAGDKLYFVADDGTHGPELWVMDAPAPRLLRDASIVALSPRPDLARHLPLAAARHFYLAPVEPLDVDPEASIVANDRRPLVFYALEGSGILQLAKTGNARLRFAF